jgi:hypothetical protein
MNVAEEFLRHAADCQQMAKFTHDRASRETWSRMAERWMHCAEVFDRQCSAARPARMNRFPRADETSH